MPTATRARVRAYARPLPTWAAEAASLTSSHARPCARRIRHASGWNQSAADTQCRA